MVLTTSFAQYQTPDPKFRAGGTAGSGSTIVKSVDARGHILYSDHAMDGYKEINVMKGASFASAPAPIASAPTKPSSAGGIVDWAQKTQAQLDESNKSLTQINEKVAKQNCQNAKESLASLGREGRIVRMGADGKPQYLTPDQIAADQNKAKEAIAQFCK